MASSKRSEMVGAERQQKDDGDWHADHPQQDGTHDSCLRPSPPGEKMVRHWNRSLAEDTERLFGMALASFSAVKYSPPR